MEILLIFLGICAVTTGLPDYRTRIPNGENVPHSCFPQSIWKGVGHQNSEGGGFLNPFGEDFKTNGFKWDECLCMTDSDGDGKTNGEELGDPNCVWMEGDTPESDRFITHPGVCEPTSSALCMERNTWEVCEPIEFKCYGMDDPDTFEVETTFAENITLPATETNYFCQAVQFDETVDMHGFAMVPILDNVDIVHHIDMYGCADGDQTNNALENYMTPAPCGSMGDCGETMLAAWALGINGICLEDDVGIRFGKNGAKVAMLKIHYHNPFLKEGEMDASGFLFYMTTNIRPNDASVINIGQYYLEIPPGQPEYKQHISCHHCTPYFGDTIYLSFGAMHMHYMGTGGYAELWRNGQFVENIMTQDFYDYNAPHIETLNPPIRVEPGDEIRHTCRFSSLNREDVVYWGAGVMQEMCHVYFVYYPTRNISTCFNEGEIEECGFRYAGYELMNLDDCVNEEFDAIFNEYLWAGVSAVCDGSSTDQECRPGCAEVVEWAHSNHTCLMGHKRDYTVRRKGGEFTRMMNSCKQYPEPEPVVSTTPRTLACGDEGGLLGGTGQTISSAGLTVVASVMVLRMKQQ